MNKSPENFFKTHLAHEKFLVHGDKIPATFLSEETRLSNLLRLAGAANGPGDTKINNGT